MGHYREISPDKILRFASTPGFKGWKPFFSEESILHPAKMNLNLLRYILKTYTEKGDIVLDPMAGTGSTMILASSMGRHGIAVEYEAKFCKMIDENIYLLEKQSSFIPRGKAICIEGDARELSKHLIESDVIISSPPYGNRLSDVAIQDGDPARMGYRQTVDVVLTSPPYGADNANLKGREDKSAKSVLETTGMRAVQLGEENIGNLKGDPYYKSLSKVYSECLKSLKPLGKMIIVVKNFIQNKQVIRLDTDTIKLCEVVGFKLIDHLYFKLPSKSFWLNLYHQKYPNAPKVDYEDVLVFEKSVVVPPTRRQEE